MSLPVPVLALPSPGGPMTLRVGRRPRWAPSRGSRARTLLCPQGPCPRRGAGGCAGPGPAAPGPVRLVWVGRPRTRRWQYARPRRGSRARGHGPVSVVRQDGLHGPGVAPSVASLARVLAGQGRGSAPSPARRPPGRPGAAVRLPRSRTPAGSRLHRESSWREAASAWSSSLLRRSLAPGGGLAGRPGRHQPRGCQGPAARGVRAYGVPPAAPGPTTRPR